MIFGKNVWPICIPDSENTEPNHLNRYSVTLVGYGPPTDQSKGLNQISYKVYSKRECDYLYDPENAATSLQADSLQALIRSTLPNKFEDSLICAGDRSNPDHGTCPGDSG